MQSHHLCSQIDVAELALLRERRYLWIGVLYSLYRMVLCMLFICAVYAWYVYCSLHLCTRNVDTWTLDIIHFKDSLLCRCHLLRIEVPLNDIVVLQFLQAHCASITELGLRSETTFSCWDYFQLHISDFTDADTNPSLFTKMLVSNLVTHDAPSSSYSYI